MEQLTNPHDKLFRDTWSDRTVAQDFLRNYLPSDILALLDLDALEIVKDSFVTPALQEYFSDVLYKVMFAGRPGYVYLLFEHKSYPETWIHLQLLDYLVSIWRLHLQQQPGSRRKKKPRLPVVIPLVLYHGQKRWTTPLSFAEQFDVSDDVLRRYLPDFEYILRDLTDYSDDDIRGAVLGRVALLLLKHIFDPDLASRLPSILGLMHDLFEQRQDDGLRYLRTFLRYVMSASEKVTRKNLETIVIQALSNYAKGGEVVMTLAEQLQKEGYEQGMQQGMQRGMQQGMREGLIEGIALSLDLKFGENGLALMPFIQTIHNLEQLHIIKNAIKTSQTLAELQAVVLSCS